MDEEKAEMACEKSILLTGWKQLLKMYLAALSSGIALGFFLIKLLHVPPELVFQLSSGRVSHVVTVFDAGMRLGIDQGVLIFTWNVLAALVSMGFFFCFHLFDPLKYQNPPRFLRKIIRGQKPMTLLCYLPGCRTIDSENIRRLYVWLMIPLLGVLMLGLESGMLMTVGSDSLKDLFFSFLTFLPHGIIEIPAFTLAGAVTYAGHLLVKEEVRKLGEGEIFLRLNRYQQSLQPLLIASVVTVMLFGAAMIEAHVTTRLAQYLFR